MTESLGMLPVELPVGRNSLSNEGINKEVARDNRPQPAPALWNSGSRDIDKNKGAVLVLKVHRQQGNMFAVSTG